MGFQVRLLCFGVLLLSFLSLCYGKNVTIKVIGLMHCKDCMRTQFSSNQDSLGIDVLIRCKSRNKEMNTQGNGAIDREGKFNITLSTKITSDGNTIDGCFAKLQSGSSTSCPIQSPQTASINLISNEENATQVAKYSPTLLKFSPITCQSAFFCPFIKFPPPSPAQSPLPPPENSSPPPALATAPSYSPPAPEFESPSPPPHFNVNIPPTPMPVVQTPQGPPSPPPVPVVQTPQGQPPLVSSPTPVVQTPQGPPSPPPVPVVQTPQGPPPLVSSRPSPPPLAPQIPPSNEPIPPPKTKFPISKPPLPHSPPPYSNQFPPPLAPPPLLAENPYPPPPQIAHNPYASPPLPKLEEPSPPNQRKPNPIPRAPPVPRLPPIPTVPRKYFNPPKSESQPPQSSYPSHS
ncbi:hypothetical protein CDL12_14648 [Handroanthus impetiginosus]|uniref:Uncharacterized protein n=1 Tax=Handroanthus impetiginosus TaxID=429701 RepID=A0A2G9H607_9LAMI|nr:hypothetical protein CDL12_14648 [Handroanthus impetiginosus]